MDTEPVYELRERLRAAAIAGTSLLSEDFRLRRAYEAFKPLETASPVFAKVGQMTGQLLTADCQNPQGALLDTLALADAVICTLGTVEVKGTIAPAGTANAEGQAGNRIVNAPYSTLKRLLDALTTSGSGHYEHIKYICGMHENHPELFRDYRVRYAFVQALGASGTELADRVASFMEKDGDRTILPFLYRDFDPKGKKEMVRRVKVIEALAGADANDFYIKMLDGAQKDVRQALILALRHEPENLPLLLDLAKTEKGKNRDTVLGVLADREDERVHAYFRELVGKQQKDSIKYLVNATSSWSAEMVAGICDRMLEQFDRVKAAPDLNQECQECVELAALLHNAINAMFGKSGAEIYGCYRKLLGRREEINGFIEVLRKRNIPFGYVAWQYDRLWNDLRNCKRPDVRALEEGLGTILQQTMVVNPDPGLRSLAIEIYEDLGSSFLAAAVMARFLGDEDCTGWLEEQVATAEYPPKRMDIIREAASYIEWDGKNSTYKAGGSYADICGTGILHRERPVRLSHARELMRWFKGHISQETDVILMRWLPLNDKEMCREMGEYFHDRLWQGFEYVFDSRKYLGYMKKCGWTECKGLGVRLVENRPRNIGERETYLFLTELPGGHDVVAQEYQAICDLVDSGKITVVAKAYEGFRQRMEEWLEGKT